MQRQRHMHMWPHEPCCKQHESGALMMSTGWRCCMRSGRGTPDWWRGGHETGMGRSSSACVMPWPSSSASSQLTLPGKADLVTTTLRGCAVVSVLPACTVWKVTLYSPTAAVMLEKWSIPCPAFSLALVNLKPAGAGAARGLFLVMGVSVASDCIWEGCTVRLQAGKLVHTFCHSSTSLTGNEVESLC